MRTVFEHQVSVRWRDVDTQGHVNHAVFLTYLEEGQDAFYVQALGRDPHYVVARVEIDLRARSVTPTGSCGCASRWSGWAPLA